MSLSDRVAARDKLNSLALDYNELAACTPGLGHAATLKRQAAQLRLVAVRVMNGTYEPDLAEAWFEAGRLTILKRGHTND